MSQDVISAVASHLFNWLLPVLAVLSLGWIKRKLGTEKFDRIRSELRAKQALVETAVVFVEQVYKDLHGPEKYQKAVEWLTGAAIKYGVSLTDHEIKGLIEAAVKSMNDAVKQTA